MGKYSLKEVTKEVHHLAERHPIGESMANGTITEDVWADWINCLFTIHSWIDPELPEELRRVDELEKDLEECNVSPYGNTKTMEYVLSLITHDSIDAATYVFTGAHLMGGAITAKNIRDRLPVNHLDWENRKEAVKLWNPLRDREELADEAMDAFETIIEIMDEILTNRGYTRESYANRNS
jgi:hypothetical protein